MHLDVEWLVLLEEGLHELEVVLHLLHLPQELLGKLRIPLTVLYPGVQVYSLQLQLYDLFVVGAALLQQLLYVTGLMLTVILQLAETVVEGDHATLHLTHGCLSYVLELIHLLRLGILFFHHQLHLPV